MGAVIVRQLEERDLDEADRIFRLAFGTFNGLPDPATYAGDADFVRSRWRADPAAALGAEIDGKLAGSNFLTQWGSVGFFGPLTVHPEHWGHGVAQSLLEPTRDIFESWKVTSAGLYTYAQSPKHLTLYQKFDFWPRFLTSIMGRPVSPEAARREVALFSAVEAGGKEQVIGECRELTSAIYAGLDVRREITAADAQKLGDTVLVYEESRLAALAVCHCGAGSEAGSGICHVKFGAAATDRHLRDLLGGCEVYAAKAGVATVRAGVNTARHEAYRIMIDEGFGIIQQGIVMQRGNEVGYNRPGVYLLDDWR